MSKQLLLKGGRLIDPASRADSPADVLVDDGRVAEVGSGLDAGRAEVVDCDGLVVCPGLVDLHVHLREPGREDAETIETGSRAAALGGYTAVCPMPNTDPVADNAGVVEMVAARGREVGLVDVFPVGAVTLGQRGSELAELGAMARSAAAVDCFSDDGRPIREAGSTSRPPFSRVLLMASPDPSGHPSGVPRTPPSGHPAGDTAGPCGR